VAEGQIHGLVGPNGAGKTTLLGLLLGLAVADGGRLEILGTPVGRARGPRGRRRFRRWSRSLPLADGRQNLAALVALRGPNARTMGIDEALHQVGLTDLADDRVCGFSLGLRQRLGLAAALLTAVAATHQFGNDQVGQVTGRGQVVSSDQYIAPHGERLVLQKGKIMSSAVSPDGSHLAASVADGGMALAVVDLKSWKVQQYVGNNVAADLRIPANDLGQEGPTYSPDGSQLWLGQADGYRKFTVNPDGSLANPAFVPIAADGMANPTAAPASIVVGLHPTALFARNGAVFVTNTATNNVSVIDTRRGKVVQTIATQPWPEASVGYEPDGVTLTDDGHLLVSLGRANAVAVYRYTNPLEPVSYVGLLPTDYFPAEIATVGKDVVVSNTRGVDARRVTTSGAHATHDTTSSLTRFTLPDDHVIRANTAKVFQQNGWTRGSVQVAQNTGRGSPVPVPQRLGQPSTIKHDVRELVAVRHPAQERSRGHDSRRVQGENTQAPASRLRRTSCPGLAEMVWQDADRSPTRTPRVRPRPAGHRPGHRPSHSRGQNL
jgi:hypothetical protein